MEKLINSSGRPQHSPEFLRKRKFYLVVPLLVLPFITMAFWALGGGTDQSSVPAKNGKDGFDMVLPSAQFKNTGENDKMAAYQAAAKNPDTTGFDGRSFKGFSDQVHLPDSAQQAGHAGPTADEQSAKIEAKLADINRQLNQPPAANFPGSPTPDQGGGKEVELLQRMMNNMRGNADDPEMRQLSQVLKQINELQNPGSDNEIRYASLKNKQRAYPVLAAKDEDEADGVTGISAEQQRQKQMPNAIEAVVHGDQTLVSGAVVKLRLLSGVYINGRLIPKGSFIYGSCALNNERLIVKISSIRYLTNILPVSLSVYDLDGMEGLYVPGSISRDAAKDGASNAVQSLQLMSMNQGLGTQAAGAGIEAAKGLFGRKVKLVKVNVKAGYQVLLKDNNQRDI